MKYLAALMALAALAGCGLDAATTAATTAAVKKQEAEQAKQTVDRVQAQLGEALAQAQNRTQAADDAAGTGGR